MPKRKILKTNRVTIVNAALEIIDQAGIDGLTIRGVAALAGAPPMSLYSHFEKKEQLLDLLYEDISSRLYPGPEHDAWPSALSSFCHNIRELLLVHPRWAPLLSRPAPVLLVPRRERLLTLMTTAGLSARDALATLSSAGLLALGLTTVELSYRDRDGVSPFAKRYDNLRALREDSWFASENPTTRDALARLPTLDLGENFSSTVGAFIAGLEARFAHEPPLAPVAQGSKR
jgi:AcrR family transcriptional regulator